MFRFLMFGCYFFFAFPLTFNTSILRFFIMFHIFLIARRFSSDELSVVLFLMFSYPFLGPNLPTRRGCLATASILKGFDCCWLALESLISILFSLCPGVDCPGQKTFSSLFPALF